MEIKSILIKDTTREERIRIIQEGLNQCGGACDFCNGVIPITSLGTTHYTTGAGNIKRFNMFNSATISGEAAHGYSSGHAYPENSFGNLPRLHRLPGLN